MNYSGSSLKVNEKKGSVFPIILGYLFSIVSLLYYPFIFGVLGVAMGIIASKNGRRSGVGVIVVSLLFMGVGIFYSGVILNYVTHYLGL